ncbi:hypothetical protein E1292_18175 [Nonomuraea deserti]|uniref:Uncharacterized protein n=1 Tax=Nonomuraea deserti TaxID=1848322 RepID=A0A4R4VQG4_9ACTN|nr:hypothetical protein [Nonomuraea deserti]TDD04794.1 hypothetical protein E1292_18175 [Nonomuraea deserti]
MSRPTGAVDLFSRIARGRAGPRGVADAPDRASRSQPSLQPGVRQLQVLRDTYPGWRIWRERTSTAVSWHAELRRQVSAGMRSAGVAERIRRGGALELASALAHQASLVHNSRAWTWPP